MDRRDSIKLILAAAVAPAFIANGLMSIKPVFKPAFDTEFIKMLRDDPNIRNIKPLFALRYANAKKMQAELYERLFWGKFAMLDKGVEKLEENGIDSPFKTVTQNAIYIKKVDLWRPE